MLDAGTATPRDLVQKLRDGLAQRLRMGDVFEISAGRLAVTIRYRDGTELQLLPAVERDGHTAIASEDGNTWRTIRPHKFAEKLSEVNAANGRAVVPTIKLAKAVLANLPPDSRLSGYHVEAIAVDAFRAYKGRRDRASMLRHLISHTQKAVLRPTGDITGQSVRIDDHLGSANSAMRRDISRAIRTLASKLESGNAEDYRRLLHE